MPVHEQLKYLISLQQIDSNILHMTRILNRIPSRIAAAELPLKESRSAFDTIKQKIDALEKKKKEEEGQLDEINEKLSKQKGRVSEIKTNKEYQAHLKEIESVEKERDSVEEKILMVMEEIDTVSRKLKREEEKIKKEMQKIDVAKAEIETEKAEIEKQLHLVRQSRTQVADGIDPDVYKEYFKLVEALNGVAVIAAKDEICQGCNMNIPPQLFVEVKKNEEIIHCPQCRRILFFEAGKEFQG